MLKFAYIMDILPEAEVLKGSLTNKKGAKIM